MDAVADIVDGAADSPDAPPVDIEAGDAGPEGSNAAPDNGND
jgi:hypothetical protein